ncbi:helix-turn-helix domain-containing protein [Chitinophaga rhizosphaerae]|uniref:helix-turn-helix domain-containing protein n=1 Tax=Chitinophaga rhizosphaerae TaxID=1864947 RepID=UPI000F80F494|nr:AraC family transcriptional regulator [Chitinophaga rhizosphaerae]
MKHNETKEKRSTAIVLRYFDFINRHIDDVLEGAAPEFLELNQIARELAVSHQHLTDIVQKEKGNHPCHFYDAKIIEKAKVMLADQEVSIAEVAMKLTYDPSNFSKFFKKWTGKTPGEFRKSQNKGK